MLNNRKLAFDAIFRTFATYFENIVVTQWLFDGKMHKICTSRDYRGDIKIIQKNQYLKCFNDWNLFLRVKDLPRQSITVKFLAETIYVSALKFLNSENTFCSKSKSFGQIF